MCDQGRKLGEQGRKLWLCSQFSEVFHVSLTVAENRFEVRFVEDDDLFTDSKEVYAPFQPESRSNRRGREADLCSLT